MLSVTCRHAASRSRALVALMALGVAAASLPALAQDKVVATVNGKNLTEADIALADTEIGGELGQLPPATKRRLLLEFIIENQMFADAAETAKMNTGPIYEQRMAFWKRRALRDIYFENNIRGAVKDADAKAFYDEQVKQLKPEEEVSARHILVDDKVKADDLAAKLKSGGDFDALAKEHSKDPGSKDQGGSLGFFGRGQMVPQFEEAAFKLKKGEVSDPVQSQFGWHVIRVDDTRTRQPPAFEAVKDRIVQSLIGQKAQAIATELRGKTKVEYVDPEIKKAVEAESAGPAGAKKP